MTRQPDLFSRFVNWLNTTGADRPVISHPSGGKDFFSRLMNRISG
jgi:hypothetical protein